MPELPEVERARRLVLAHCKDKTVTKVHLPSDVTGVVDSKLFKHCTETDFANAARSKRLVDAHRKGKHGWLEFSDDVNDDDGGNTPSSSSSSSSFVLFHLGMTGSFSVKGVKPPEFVEFTVDGSNWPPKFWKFVLEFNHGETCLAYTDPRRFGRVQLRTECPTKSLPVKALGFDPYLEQHIPKETFGNMFRRRNAAIKSVLLDQSVAAGVGNWMADEMLYRAKIHPEVKACDLNEEALMNLREAMFEVTNVAVENNADSRRFPSDWLFHNRWGKNQKAKMANGEKISFCEVGGRTTAFVATRQKKMMNTIPDAKKRVTETKKTSSKNASTTTSKGKREEEPVTAKKVAKRAKKSSAGGGGGGGATANRAARVTRNAIKSAYFLFK